MQGRLSVDSLKSAGNGPIHSPVNNPIKNKTNQTKKGKQNKQSTPKHTNTKNQTRHREVGSLPALRNKMHDDILCVIMSMARKRSKNKDNPEKHKGAIQGGERSNKAQCGNRGIPPARIPEITESSHSGITFTQALPSKQRRRCVVTSERTRPFHLIFSR